MCHEDQRRDDLVVIDELLGIRRLWGGGGGVPLTALRPGRRESPKMEWPRVTKIRVAVALFACVVPLSLASCGGDTTRTTLEETTTTTSSGHSKAVKQLTVPAYAGYPAITVPITRGTPARCRLDAKAFTRDAVAFLAPSPPTPPDVYFLNARTTFVDFEAHRCGLTYLRRALSRRLTATQRRRVVGHFTFLGEIGRELTRRLRGNEAQPGG
jgi:hypothetical protein